MTNNRLKIALLLSVALHAFVLAVLAVLVIQAERSDIPVEKPVPIQLLLEPPPPPEPEPDQVLPAPGDYEA